MWNPAIAHHFHLRRGDMLDVRLNEYLVMVDSMRG